MLTEDELEICTSLFAQYQYEKEEWEVNYKAMEAVMRYTWDTVDLPYRNRFFDLDTTTFSPRAWFKAIRDGSGGELTEEAA